MYAVWHGAQTVNEIADRLGVSLVYVESEAEYLAEYGSKSNTYVPSSDSGSIRPVSSSPRLDSKRVSILESGIFSL